MKREEVIAALVSIGVDYDQEELSWKSTAYLEWVLTVVTNKDND